MTIKDFIERRNNDYDAYEARPDWNGYKVYEVWLKANKGACVGLPQYALEKNGSFRLASHKEVFAIMDAINGD